jgi:hypothetical protein
LLNGLSIPVIENESLPRKQTAAHLESLGADVTAVGSPCKRPAFRFEQGW